MKLGKNRLAIRPDVVSQVSGAGLVIPEGSREKPDRGTVIAVGDGSVWSVGDKVSFPKHLGFTTEDAEGYAVVVLFDEDVLYSS